MKIGYYEENRYHTEIIGVFLQTLNHHTIVVYNTVDNSKTIQFYHTLYQFEQRPKQNLINEYKSYDLIIIGSSSNTKDFIDKLGDDKIDYNKFIFVCHLKSDIKEIYKYVIVLTPLNIISPKTVFVLPIHNIKMNNDENIVTKPIFTIIGRFKDNNRDTSDLVKLITNYHTLNFIVYIFSRTIKFIPKVLFNLAKTYPSKLKIFLNTNSEKMDEYLRQSKFILPLVSKNSWYHKDRLSGNIPLAFNYNVPLIIDNKLKEIYQIDSCLSYENKLSEVIETAVNITNNEYRDLVNKFVEYKNHILDQNCKSLDMIINNG